MLPIIIDSDNEYMADNGFMASSGNDTRVQDASDNDKPYCIADNKTLTAVPILPQSQNNLFMTTGNSDWVTQPMIFGYGGYFTVDDHEDLEFGNNFSVNMTDVGAPENGNLYVKRGSYSLIKSTNLLTFNIYNTPTTNYVIADNVTDPDNAWANDANASDNNTGNYASISAGQTNYLVANFSTATWCNTVKVWGDNSNSNNLACVVDVYFNGAWVAVFSGAVAPTGTTISIGSYQNVTAVRIKSSDASYSALVYEIQAQQTTYTVAKYVSAVSSATEFDNITVLADTTNLVMYLDNVSVNTTTLSGVSVINNSNDIIFGSSATAYIGSISITTNGTLRATYAPTSMIMTTVLPNSLNPGTYNGAITWGTNPAGITATLGALISGTQPSPGAVTTIPSPDLLPTNAGGTNWFGEPDETELHANPFYEVVKFASETTGLTTFTETQVWRFFGIWFVLLLTAAAAIIVRGHLLVASVICCAAIWFMVHLTIFPLVILVALVPVLLVGLVMERSPSV